MSLSFTPRKWQRPIIDTILDNDRCSVWADMGLGKTAAALTAVDILRLAGDITKSVLVLAPLRVANKTWPDEIVKWDHLKHLTCSPIIGTETERLEALSKPADIYTMNYENLEWLIDYYRKSKNDWPFEMVIADESTKLKGLRVSIQVSKKGKKFLTGQGGKRAKKLASVAHSKVRRWVNLTGTPAPNGLQDLWGQNWFVDAGRRLGRSFTEYSNRWFQKPPNGFGLEPLPFAQEQIEDAMKDVCISILAKDYFDVRQPIVNIVEVELPKRAMVKYKEMEKEMFTMLEGEEVEAFNAAVRTMKCLQLANGAAYVGEGAKEWKKVHDVKLDALNDIIEEAAGKPIIVAYHFRSDLERLKKKFKKGRVLDKNPKTMDDWNAGKIPILFAHPASAGHGLNLQDGGHIIVFFGLNWNLEEHEQIIERIGPVRQMQSGHDRCVFIYYIMAKNTVDYLVKKRLESKASVQDILKEAMRKP